jgi:hypothetical protein
MGNGGGRATLNRSGSAQAVTSPQRGPRRPTPNSQCVTCPDGDIKFPSARRVAYEVSGLMAMRVAAKKIGRNNVIARDNHHHGIIDPSGLVVASGPLGPRCPGDHLQRTPRKAESTFTVWLSPCLRKTSR